ncbi:testis-expressed protein 15 [Nycticebus coucang]|uniref:testis-expressed protein 15 n=1 Tax=Nycticebus coucang TaxID=9470 RepID=UPI00234D25C9|nr:testis-expressed protein 15 [Nycticebus coucang]
MEVKEIAKHKTLWKMTSTSEPLLITGSVANPLKKFTIPKIRRTAEKVYLSPCCTNTREYSFIHDTLNQCRLDISCGLQSSWQFGDTKLVNNEELEKNFTTKRSEMREIGRHGRELEEHFCFLALPKSDVTEICQNGISTKTSTLKILGNPLLGIYIFRHVDVALNYAHSQSITVESIMIFKVLYGKVKKIHPYVDKNKVALDPSPNFDCHMSRSVPSLKDATELQAYNSAVYFYEYSVFSKPVDKPRQCLPYAIVTVKFIGQKINNGHLVTSLRFPSTGFPKRTERTCSLNNCTVAKRIGKGKDATVIFEHFRKPVDPFAQENCSCNTVKSEIDFSNSDISDSCGNVQNGTISILDTYNGQTEHNLSEIRDTSQVHAHDSDLSFMPSDTKENVNGDHLFNWTYLKNILSGLSAAFPLQNNIGSSTVITSKLIKDPRLMRREESMGKQNDTTDLKEILPSEKSLDYVNSEIKLPPMPAVSASSEIITGDYALLTNCLDAPCFKISLDDSQSHAHNMGSKDYDCTTPTKITMTGQYKDQENFSFPISLSNVVSEIENQKDNEEKAQGVQQRSNIPLEQSSEPHNSYQSKNASIEKYNSQTSQELQSSDLKTIYPSNLPMSSAGFPLEKKESINEYIQNIGKMRNFTDPEDNFKHEEKKTWWKDPDYFNDETEICPIDNHVPSYQEYEDGDHLDSFEKNCDKIMVTQELEILKSSTPAPNNEDEHLALELQGITSSVESLSQKHPQYSLEYEDNICTNFAIAEKLMELKLEKTNENCVNIITNDFQEAKDILQAKDMPIDRVISSHDIETALESSNCNITRENVCIHRKNEPVSLESIQGNCGEIHTEHESQHPTVFLNAQLDNDTCLDVNFREQGDNDEENQNEARQTDSTSFPENNIKNIHRDEKQGFHIDKNFTNIDERRENKNYSNVEIPSSEEFSTPFNLIWEEKYVSTETTLLESEDAISGIEQKDEQNAGSVEYLAATTFPKITDSSECASSRASVQIAHTPMLALSTQHEDSHRHQFEETCSESPDLGLLVKHRAPDSEVNIDNDRLQDSLHQSNSENSVLQDFELENEIEVGSEQGDDACLFQQDTESIEDVFDERDAAYEILKSRIDWEGLFGSHDGKSEVWESTIRKENNDQYYYKKSILSSSTRNKTELLSPILLPDLQITITNISGPGFSPTADSLASEDNFWKRVTEATKERNKEGGMLGFGIYSQPSGNNSGENEVDEIRQESGLVSKSEISLSIDLSHNIHASHMSDRQNSESLFTVASTVTGINDGRRCSFTKSKNDCNNSRSEKGMELRINKRKLGVSSRDQNIPHKDSKQHEILGKKRRLTNPDPSKCFSSLSQGRIKTFSWSEKHIRGVLDILNSEASLCKSRRLSRKLDRAVVHLKKAHRRVNTSLQIITKVGEKRKGPLPKSYAIICNNFWESCDLQGYNSVSERRYYSTKHFLSKKRYNKQGEKRALGSDGDESLTHVSKHKSYKTNGKKITKCLSKKSVTSKVSKSHTVHAREFCDREHRESQLSLSSISQSTSQSAYSNNNTRNPGSSELQPFPRKTRYLSSPDHSDEKLSEKENQINTKFLPNMSNFEKLQSHSAHTRKNTTKEHNCEASRVTSGSNSVSLCCLKENPSYSTDKNYDATCIAHKKVRTDILFSVLESTMDICKQGNLILPDCKRNLKVNFPIEKYTAPIETFKQSIITENFLMDPLHPTLIASKKYSSPQLFSTASVTNRKGEFWKSYLGKQRTFDTDSFAASHYQQICCGKELLKTEQCSSANCFLMDGNETNVPAESQLNLTPVTEESKSYGENVMKKQSSIDSSQLLKDNMKGSSKSIVKKDIQDRKMWGIKQAQKAKDSVCKRSTNEGSAVETEYKDGKNEIVKESSHLNNKMIKNNLVDCHVTIKDAVSLNNIVFNQLNKREQKGKIKTNGDCQSDSTLHSETAYISKPDILGIHSMPVLHAHSEISEVTTRQKSTSYTNELNEKHGSANHTALITKLSQILRRADEASSLQALQEETKVCQKFFPLFVEAFESKQECSFEQIVISRELLVEQNMWNNCRHKLKPSAVDTLVELQMMMETIQFIENKKRLLGGEPTFRSLLWYDETLYSELLGRPCGYQQQSNFYPAFQGRLKYNAFCELQTYHGQLIELFEETKRGNNSYYAFLKYKRQINECEAIMKHCSDCFDFSLSVPFTCGVNFGDSLGDLETLRKSTLKLISIYGDSPKILSYPGKQDHLWIIIEMISSKVNFIKNNEALNIKISLYGLEHIFFDAAKSLIWKERRKYFSKKYSEKNSKEMILKMNQCAYSKLQKIYDTLSEDLNSEPVSDTGVEKDTIISSRKSDYLMNKATTTIENDKLNNTLLLHPDICYISEILDQAEFADLKKLQELTLRCIDHLEFLKKYFQMLQEENIDNIFITEENVLDMAKKHNHGAVILKPEAVETYVEIVMISETVHFLKNSVAKKLDKPRFRGMLWFDLSLLPELVHCQEKMASFSFLKDNSINVCLGRVIETSISELKKDMDIICKYSEAVNGSYALHLLSRELQELSEIKKLLKKSKYSISTYIDFVPYIMSINYGSTVTDLDYNYNQFSILLKNTMSAPKKDLGKVTHIMKIMKTIEHMKIICAKNPKLTISFVLCQMMCNRKKTFPPKRKENGSMNIHTIKPGENIDKSSISVKVSLIPECTIKNVSNCSKKRPITVDKCEDSEEQEKSTISRCKKQKVNVKGVAKISREKTAYKHPRTTEFHPKSENKTESSSSDNLKRNYVFPEKIEMQSLLPGSLLPLKNLKDTCSLKAEGKIDLSNVSFDTSEHFTGEQGNLIRKKKRNKKLHAAETKSGKKDCTAFAVCDQESVEGTFSKDHETFSQKFLKNSPDSTQQSCPLDTKPEAAASLVPNASVLSEPASHFMKDIHTNLEMNDKVLELQDIEILNSSIKNSTCSTCTSSPEPVFIQEKIPIPEINKTQPAKSESEEKYIKDTLNPSTIPFGAPGHLTLNVTQTAEYSFSEQQNDENSKVLTQNTATYWNELPQSACTPIYNSSEHSFGTSYPYYSWYVYHYSSSNGSAITQTHQGITSYEVQPPPGMLTAIASTVQSTHSNLLYSQYFSCYGGEPQAYGFVPVNGNFQSPVPISYNFQQPTFSHYASHQPLPQVAYSYPPNPTVLPEVPWIYSEFHKF